jgi:arylsulfatase A-like enzyme/Tfp pilus assembly protein PilF
VLLITLDTTRADRLGCYGYQAGQTPVLDTLAAAGVLCERALTVAPQTLPAHVSMFTGLYPVESGIATNGRGRLDDSIPTLAESLKRQGYDTAAFVASFVLDRKFGLDRGFNTYDDDFTGEEPVGEALHRQRHGAAVVDAALTWLGAKRERPFFCWVHLYDPHAPYLSHAELFGDQYADRPYDAEIAYVDRQVGRLVDFLKNQKLETNTLVVVAGDHGEGLEEHVEKQHGMTLYQEVLHVPLIFRHVGRLSAQGRVAANVSLVDLSPTILDLLGITDRRQVTGKSLKPLLAGGEASHSLCFGATDEPFLNNGWSPLRSLTDGQWKYIRTTKPELYDLAADPHERNNLLKAAPDTATAMASRLAELESRLAPRAPLAVQLTASERRTLRSLGYLGDSQPVVRGPAPADLSDVKDMLPFDAAVDQAGELLAQKSVDAAIRRLRDVIHHAPGHSKAYWILACALRDQGEFDEALDILHSLSEVKPESREAHYGLALVFVELKQHDEAIAELLRALQIDPEFAEAHFDLAMLSMRLGRSEEALSHFDTVLELDHCHAAAYQWRAYLLARLGRADEAIADFQAALKYTPDSAHTHHNYGIVLAKQGRLADARQHLTRAVELGPENAEFRCGLGAFLVREGDYAEAIRQLDEAVLLKPDYQAAQECLLEARQGLHAENRKPQ